MAQLHVLVHWNLLHALELSTVHLPLVPAGDQPEPVGWLPQGKPWLSLSETGTQTQEREENMSNEGLITLAEHI